MTHHCPRSNWTGPGSELRRGICPKCAETTLYEDCSVRPVTIIGTRERREMESMRRELEALRALEAHIRGIEGMASGGAIGGRTGELLAAVEEARKP